jgi:serine/threonine protein kinase
MYSLGCTFFHMLTGRPPFEGDSLYTIMERQMSAPIPSIVTFSPNVPDRLTNIIYTMVEKSPDNRYQTYEQLLTVLEAAREGKATLLTTEVVDASEAEKAESDRRKLKRIYLAAGLVAALFVAWIIYTSNKGSETKRPTAENREGIYDDRPEGGLSRTLGTIREINEVDKEVRKDAREVY